MKFVLLAAAMLSAVFCSAYTLHDAGDFAPAGYRVEFADRYGWRGYQADFDFGLDLSGRALTRNSKLTVTIALRDGSNWSYTCKAKGCDGMSANINSVFGLGVSIVAECRIPETKFAKAVGLDPDDVGRPNLVFQAVLRDGEAHLGAQRGIYFLPGGQIEASELSAYAGANDPSALAVIFQSKQ